MKNLKKALALFVAAASVFGTIASAELSFVNPVTNQLDLITATPSGTQSWQGNGRVGADVYDYSTTVDGALVMTTKDSITDFTAKPGEAGGGPYSTYTLNTNGGVSAGGNSLRRSSFGKTKVVLEFSLKPTSNSNYTGNAFNGDTGEIKIMAVEYSTSAGATAQEVVGTGLKWHSPNADGTYAIKFSDYIKEDNHWNHGEHKLRLTGEFDPATMTITLSMVDTENNNGVIFNSQKTLPEGATFKFVRPCLYMRTRAATAPILYKYEYTGESAETENSAITVTDTNLNASVDVYGNLDTGIPNGPQNKPVVAILAQYDANDHFISCTSASGEYQVVGTNADWGAAARATVKTLTPSMAKDANYAYAKLFVWDSNNTMNPLAEVYSNKVN